MLVTVALLVKNKLFVFRIYIYFPVVVVGMFVVLVSCFTANAFIWQLSLPTLFYILIHSDYENIPCCGHILLIYSCEHMRSFCVFTVWYIIGIFISEGF